MVSVYMTNLFLSMIRYQLHEESVLKVKYMFVARIEFLFYYRRRFTH